ncbi:MAG TPA: protein YgfX [Pseudomonadales bacterium]|nr:protein YgfX [Pseudomonadales bacterium]
MRIHLRPSRHGRALRIAVLPGALCVVFAAVIASGDTWALSCLPLVIVAVLVLRLDRSPSALDFRGDALYVLDDPGGRLRYGTVLGGPDPAGITSLAPSAVSAESRSAASLPVPRSDPSSIPRPVPGDGAAGDGSEGTIGWQPVRVRPGARVGTFAIAMPVQTADGVRSHLTLWRDAMTETEFRRLARRVRAGRWPGAEEDAG